MRLFINCKNLVFAVAQCGKIQRLQSISCKGKLRLLRGGERFRRGVGQCVDFGGVLVKPKAGAAVKNRREADPFQGYCITDSAKIAEVTVLIANQISRIIIGCNRSGTSGIPSFSQQARKWS